MIKTYLEEGFDPVSFIISIIIGLMLMMSMTGVHTWYIATGFLIISTFVIMSVDMLFYLLFERGDIHG